MSKSVFADTVGVYLYNAQQNSTYIRSNGSAEDQFLSSLYDAGAEYTSDYVEDEYGETAGAVADAFLDYGKEKAGLTSATQSSRVSSAAQLASQLNRVREQNQKFFYGRLRSPDFIENQWGIQDVDVSWNTKPQDFPEISAFEKSHVSNSQLASNTSNHYLKWLN